MEQYVSLILIAITAFAIIKIVTWVLSLRRVVAANEVHIVQTRKDTVSYGKDTDNGNTYYEWPSWLPLIGVSKVVLRVSVFDLDLSGYEAYDKGRLPFKVDVKAFFRISNSNLAAQRVASFDELKDQLQAIVQGAVRTILASNEIEEIMQGRAKFGAEFTQEVSEQLTNWGVVAVKNIELMDLRDAEDSTVIRNIMEKKQSQIQMESRVEVAANNRTANIAEIEAVRDTDIQKQNALQVVGQRTAEKEQLVGIANEKASQAIQEEQKVTKEKAMAVVQVERVAQANIEKEVRLVKEEEEKLASIKVAEAAKEASVISAQASKESTELVAAGELKKSELGAKGIMAEGEAKAAAETAILLAPVTASTTLAKEIGENQGYQNYLLSVENIKAAQAIGVAQAEALKTADVKIIANTGDNVGSGINKVTDLFSAKGGMNLGSMVEAFTQTEGGKAIVEKFANTQLGKGDSGANGSSA